LFSKLLDLLRCLSLRLRQLADLFVNVLLRLNQLANSRWHGQQLLRED